MKKKVINIILGIVNLGLTALNIIQLLNRSSAEDTRADAANTTGYILIGLFGVLSIVFFAKAFKKQV